MQRANLSFGVAIFLATFSAAPSRAATKVVMIYNATSAYAASYVAQEEGYFAKHGLDLEFSLTGNTTMTPAALMSQTVQLGGITPPMILQANEQGLDLVVVAGATTTPDPAGTSGMLARTGSGIKTAQDMIGRKVGVPGLGGALDVLGRNWVKTSGVDYHKVNWVEVQFPQMIDGLKSGLVDAVVTAEPFNTRIKSIDAGYFLAEAEGPKGTATLIYTATRAWTKKNPEALKEFRAAIEDAYTFARNPANAESVKGSIAKYTKLPPAAMASIVVPNTLEAKVTSPSLAFWVDVARDQGMIKGNPDPASLVAP
jgi:NitT/TauT family transport system substrate-binding protein